MQPRDKDSINWAECQNNPIDINFHLKKVWKVSIEKSDSKMKRR